ncbi:MAG: transketolase C-terminal domain-containing protein [Candidatus Margulisiibacteriota bacterium]|nr:transketolase C-terminal domain-containing protein [Candidatus Margulisiibacteriota bacterium]
MAMQGMRNEYGKYIVELANKNKNIVALEADLKESTQSIQFQRAYPERYVEVGIAEQNMVGIAAGLSLAGKIPIAHSFACFISMRSCEQVRTTIAYPNLNVKFLVTHGGISTGTAGTTHHAIEDIAIMRSIPNMTVLVPGDVAEMKQVVEAAFKHNGPVYIRLGAGDAWDIYTEKDKFEIGKATEIRSGNDATIITTGIMMYEGMQAADILKKEHGLNVRVLQMASVKPLDEISVQKAAEETGKIITVEEHNLLGGLGGAVCEVVAEQGNAKVKRIGINDKFCGVGSATCLMEEEGLTIKKIVDEVVNLCGGKL